MAEAASADATRVAGVAQALRDEIMLDVEALLSQKSDSLWKRGQAELVKMQEDREEVARSLVGLQTSQEALIAEQQSMHGALLDITAKMEFVAMEMREALRAAGNGNGKTGCAGMLGEANLGTPPAYPTASASELLAGLSALSLGMGVDFECTPPPLGADPGLLCTPPRITPQSAASLPGYSIAPPLPGSPAVLLSLASALPSAPTPSAMTSAAASYPATTRLQIAECLDMTEMFQDARHSPISNSSSALLGNGSWQSSAGSPSKVDAGSPSPAAEASFGTLNADAPVFVPCGGY